MRVSDGTTEPPVSLSELYRPLPYVVRAYVLRGLGLMPKDANGYEREERDTEGERKR